MGAGRRNGRARWTACRLVPFDGGSSGKSVGPSGAPCLDAGWSANGKWMFLNAYTGGGFHIWRQWFPDGTPERLTDGPTEQKGIAVSPDGRSLLTAVSVSSSSVWVHDRKGDHRITFEGCAAFPIPQISSRAIFDGTRLYFAGQQAPRDSWDLWAVNLSSGQSERVVPGMEMESFDLSRDGKQVVFESTGSEERTSQGDALQQLTTASGRVPRLWIADLDHHSAPRLINSESAERRPLFTSANELAFEADEGFSTYAYLRAVHGGSAANSPPIQSFDCKRLHLMDAGFWQRRLFSEKTSLEGSWLLALGMERRGGSATVCACFDGRSMANSCSFRCPTAKETAHLGSVPRPL
jgi:hypothetical protein